MSLGTMAQEANTQTIRLRKAYRETEYGGFTKTYVLTPSGQFIKPTSSERSRSGYHGWDIWQLPAGRYVVIDVNRPNTRNGPKPYEVKLECIEYTTSGSRILNTKALYVMRFGKDDLVEWAKAICP